MWLGTFNVIETSCGDLWVKFSVITSHIHRKGIYLTYCLVPQHLRVEENPILKMPHLEAASILLVGPTLKKFNDRGIL